MFCSYSKNYKYVFTQYLCFKNILLCFFVNMSMCDKLNAIFYGTKIWNSIPDLCKKQTDISPFKTSLAEWKGTVCKCSVCKFEL